MMSIVSLLTAGVLSTAAAAEPPKVEECFLVTPMIRVGEETSSAGVGFWVQDGDRTLLLSSHQVVGPAGGMKTQMSLSLIHI